MKFDKEEHEAFDVHFNFTLENNLHVRTIIKRLHKEASGP